LPRLPGPRHRRGAPGQQPRRQAVPGAGVRARPAGRRAGARVRDPGRERRVPPRADRGRRRGDRLPGPRLPAGGRPGPPGMDAPVTADVPRYPAAAPAGELGPEALMAVLPEGELASDYQWLSLHAWSPAATVSQLDGAMVGGFTDYHDTSSRFYGFCGGHDPSAIARRLLHDAERVGWPAELRLVPEGTACRLGDEFEVVEDR